MVASFLADWKFQVSVQGSMSAESEIPYGVPQGCVLSPTLYNIYTYDIPTIEDCDIAQFADDTAFYTSSRFAKQIIRRLEKGAKKLLKYFKKWKIRLNETKTQAIFFTNRRTRQLPTRKFKIGTSEIDWSNEVKYLGVVLDKKLTFRSHIQYALTKAQIAIRILYSLLNRRSKLDTRNKLLLFKVGIRPIFTYASPILHDVAKTHLQKLQICHNKVIKMALDLPRYTSTNYIHDLANIEKTREFMQKLRQKFVNQQQRPNQNDLTPHQRN